MIAGDFSLGLGYLPVFWGLFTCFTFLLCYSIAVANNHIYPFVPAISDTGAQIPESNVFSELFNFSAALVVVNVVVRYLQLRLISTGLDSSDLLLGRLNKLGVVFGVISAIGGTIIANFPSQEEENMVYVHDTGAVMLFGAGAVYCWIQTSLTYKLANLGQNSVLLFTIRLILTSILTAFGCIFFLAEMFAFDDFREQSEHTVAHWEPADPGYSVHVLSNISEWLAALGFGLFGMTYFHEFQQVQIDVECKFKEGRSRDRAEYDNLQEESDP